MPAEVLENGFNSLQERSLVKDFGHRSAFSQELIEAVDMTRSFDGQVLWTGALEVAIM